VPLVPIAGATAPVNPVNPVMTGSTASSPVAGWHPDPWGQATWRWWDGTAWSHHTA
jgi:hypothetical protein